MMEAVELNVPGECPNCGETQLLEWDVGLQARPGIAVNRLGLGDVRADAFLACERCSQVLFEEDAGVVLRWMAEQLAAITPVPPEPVDPRREAVIAVVDGKWGCGDNPDFITDILAAIDGAS